ncbi:tRNA-binding protein [Adhaeribacter radiodurans]|uniref:tRNA-binding protein n=1 Tax=Adhaeribacter radiodurans TaxID=2745197 RepID=A0A7L7L6P0_9BACT|nr:tRNA-binding protein [Adhaeribacter radiodurans]QMU28501.1 tRNA-binding protein [Adhaeribacter radiodurans]
MDQISWNDFEKVDLRVGTITEVHAFPEARKPAYKIFIDFGAFGIKKSSAQITVNYAKEELIGRQVVAVVNFPPKQIGKYISEVLITGFEDANGNIVLAQPQSPLPNGTKLM